MTIIEDQMQVEDQMQELTRGAEEILPAGGLEAKLQTGKPLVVKTGFDLHLVFVRNIER